MWTSSGWCVGRVWEWATLAAAMWSASEGPTPARSTHQCGGIGYKWLLTAYNCWFG